MNNMTNLRTIIDFLIPAVLLGLMFDLIWNGWYAPIKEVGDLGHKMYDALFISDHAYQGECKSVKE